MSTAADVLPGAPPAADVMRPEPYRIERVKGETHDTFTLELRPEGGAACRPWLPGQFNMVYVFGVGEAAISISSDPQKTGLLDHTIHRVGTVTTAPSAASHGVSGRSM